MIKIKEIFARSFDIKTISLYWSIQDMLVSDDILAYEVYILKSTAQAGPFVQIAGPLLNCFSFQDPTNVIEHKNGNVFYKLKIRDKRSDEIFESPLIAQIPKPDLIALELLRLEDLLFRVCIGRRCWIYNKKQYGRCKCYDKMSGTLLKSNCITCYGTGYLGGYSTPIEQYVQIDPPQTSLQPNQNMPNLVKITPARLINYPLVSPGDVIIENENNRWIVITTMQSERLRHPIRQEITMKQLQDSDMVYKLPVLTDIKDNIVSDKRLFTNPMSV